MNEKQCVFLRRYAARMGRPIKALKELWNATPTPRRFALKKSMLGEMAAVEAALNPGRG